MSVTRINSSAFYYATNKQFTGDLIIPPTVRIIRNDSFRNCKFTGKLILPEGLEEIWGDAFNGCSISGHLIIPNTVKRIDGGAFRNCTGFTELTLGTSLEYISPSVFSGCVGLTGELKIPDSVTHIGEDAFSYCSGFTGHLKIPDSVTLIGRSAFEYCSGFTGLTLSKSLTAINYGSFRFCTGMTGELIIPESIISIDRYAFSHCSGFTGHLKLPELTKISGYTFEFCSGFTSVSFPQSLEAIDYGAFYDCTGLTGDLILPENLKTIGYENSIWYVGAFQNCTGLNGKLILPEGLTHIGYHTFYNCSGLSGELKIPDSVTDILVKAFYNCSSFYGELSLPHELTKIDDSIFQNCSGLKGNITLPPNIESIGNESFAGCVRLTGPVTIPASVRSIGSHSFKDTRITEVVFEPNSQIETIDGSFSGCSDMANFSIPGATGSFGILNDAFNGCSSLTSLSLVGTLDKIQDKAESGCFDGCTSLRNIRFEDGENDLALVTTRESMFGDCPLDSVYLGRNLTSDSNPFKGNQSIRYFAFGDPVKTIPQEGFAGCSGLTELTIPGGMTEIGDNAFAGCDNIKKLTLLDNEEGEFLFIGNNDGNRGLFSDMPLDSLYLGRQFVSLNFKPTNVFSGMTTLKSLTIGDGVTVISDNSFSGCTSLSELHLPESLINIGKSAFAGCTALTDTLVIPSEVYQINDEAFADCSSVIAIKFEPNSGKELFCGKNAFRNIPAQKLVIDRNIQPHPVSYKPVEIFTPFAGNAALRELEIGVGSNSSIGAGYFAGCPSIKYINNYCTTPQYLHDTGFDTEVYKNAVLKVPNSSLYTYKGANGWRKFYNIYGLKDIMPEEAVITPDTLTVEVGDTYALTYTILPEDAKNKTVTWSSSDETVATVDENGLVTALLPGTATITATTINEVTAVCEVTVVIRPTEIVIEQEAELTQGESLQLTAVFTPEETTERELTWSSS
ncbi:MAG: leucine-rich repeat protein, partial [Paramuribaculum sp.]|nr:leucine-rich repeat protein [Paramuribaculum sp.]